MSDVARVTLGLVVVNIVLVVVTILYVMTVRKQLKQSEIATLEGIRYRLESDVTQIRVMKAQIVRDGAEGFKILEGREKQCTETISRVARRIEELEKRFKLTVFSS